MRSRSTCDQADVAKACNSNQFQSQMRSRSTCDIASCLHLLYRPEFQSQMRSRSTCDYHCSLLILKISFVSISDEKPLHMRLDIHNVVACAVGVSISDEKPLHMRRRHLVGGCKSSLSF